MPYISQAQRKELLDSVPRDPGELNYALTILINAYFHNGRIRNYQTMNDIIGALEACKLEFYRRIVVPYEEVKREQNGDCY
jgi:hypothetical protein